MNTELKNVINNYIEKEKLRLSFYADIYKRTLLLDLVDMMDSIKGEGWTFSELTDADIETFRLFFSVGLLGELFSNQHRKVLLNFLKYAFRAGYISKSFE